jgi:hypothetical protein
VIDNRFINCDFCETTINLRCQIGYFNIPFNLHCPTCLTHIYGKLVIDQENIGIKLELENAHSKNSEINSKDKYYSAELSAEFPTKKMYMRGFNEYDLSPFIRNSEFYGDSMKAIQATRKSMDFAHYFEKRWKTLKLYFDFLWNNQVALLYPKLEKEISNYKFITLSKVTNELDANMALHQLFLTTTGLTSVLQPGTLEEYIEISKLIVPNTESLEETQKFADSMSSEFNNIEKKAFKLIDAFSKIYEQLIPVVALRNASCLNNVDKEQYGIMTTNFEELSDFYAKSYEWILDNINIVIALNNINSRNDYNSCANGKAYDEILKIASKYKKIEYIDDLEPFSTPTNSLKNRVRNAIQHFDNEIDYMSQKIVFTDHYRGNTKQESMYLMEFADLCVENFSIIIYLLELIYQLKKLSYQSNGLIPSFILKEMQNNHENKTNIKIGRNDPCPCGSGKKYKKCCI